MLLELDLRGARLAVQGGVEHLLPLGEQGLGIVAACRRLRSRASGLPLGDRVVVRAQLPRRLSPDQALGDRADLAPIRLRPSSLVRPQRQHTDERRVENDYPQVMIERGTPARNKQYIP